jgi:protein CpxP
MTKTCTLVAGTAFTLALVTGASVAVTAAREQGPRGDMGPMGQGGPGRPGRGPGGADGPAGIIPGLRALELTATQREQLNVAMASHKAEFEAHATARQAARQALHAVVTADVFDEAAIRQTSADLAVVDADGAVLRAKVHAEVWALLTPEQQQKAKAQQAEREARRGQIRARIEQRRGPRQPRRPQGQQQRG